MQTDPIGTKDDLNLYAYAYNDSITRSDPFGLETGAAFRSINCATDRSTCGNTAPGASLSSAASGIGATAGKAEASADMLSGAAAIAISSGSLDSKSASAATATMIGAEKLARQVGPISAIAAGVEAGNQLASGDVQGATTVVAQEGVQASLTAAGGAIGSIIAPGPGTAIGLASGNFIGGSTPVQRVVAETVDATFRNVERHMQQAIGDVERQFDRFKRGCGIDGCLY